MTRLVTLFLFMLSLAGGAHAQAVGVLGPKGDKGCSLLEFTPSPSAPEPPPSLGMDCDWAWHPAEGRYWGPKHYGEWGLGRTMTPVVAAQAIADATAAYRLQAQQARDGAQAARTTASAQAAAAQTSAANAAMSAATAAEHRAAAAASAGAAEVAAAAADAKPITSRTELRAAHTSTQRLFGGDLWAWAAGDMSSAILGAPSTSTAVNSGTGVITRAGHGLTTGNAIIVTSAADGLATNTLYYVVFIDYDNFKLAANFDGAHSGVAVTLTATDPITWRRHYDRLQAIYVTPASDISGASGAWQRQSNSYQIKWRWFGADPTGVAYSDEAIAAARDWFDLSFDGAKNVYRATMDPEGGAYRIRYSVNMTGIKGLTNARGPTIGDFRVYCEVTDGICVDFLGSSFVRLGKISVVATNNNFRPRYGVVYSRAGLTEASAANDEAQYIQAAGIFTCAAFANFGAESLHIGTLEASNRYWMPGSTTTVVAGSPAKFGSYCPAGLPASKYQVLYTADSPMTLVVFDFHQALKLSAYACTVTAISKTSPAVVTVDNASGCFDSAQSNYNLVDDSRIWLGAVRGDDGTINTSSWRPLSCHVFTAKNINTGAQTLELYSEDGVSPVDASGLAGNYVAGSGALSNDAGPEFFIARASALMQHNGYLYTQSMAHILFDVSAGGDYTNGVKIYGRGELATPYFARFRSTGAQATVRGLTIGTDSSAARDAFLGVYGGQTVKFENLTVDVANAAQEPTSGVVAPFAFARLNGGTLNVPSRSWIPTPLGSANLRQDDCVSWLDGANVSLGRVCADANNLNIWAPSNGSIRAIGPIRVSEYTYAARPVCGVAAKGWVIAISDATHTGFGTNITAGGGSYSLALCDGAGNWTAR